MRKVSIPSCQPNNMKQLQELLNRCVLEFANHVNPTVWTTTTTTTTTTVAAVAAVAAAAAAVCVWI
jgi:hypothetical protein